MQRPMPDGHDGGVDLDLRVVRYFVAVAEHGHFGRAAAALHITQPSLSRQIRGLENLLGATLLERTPQGSVLTAAGAAFLEHARTMLTTSARAAAHVRAAAEPHRITVGFTTNLVVGTAVRDLRARHPQAEVATRQLTWDGACPALLDRAVDVAVTRLPIACDGVEVTVLYREPRAVLLSRHHRLANRSALDLDDLADEVIPRVGDAAWDAFWRIDPRPDGRPAPDAPLLADAAELFDFVAQGDGVLIAPADSRVPDLQPDLVAVPLHGVAPGEVAVVHRIGETSPLVAAFADCATRLMRPGRPSRRA
jgi:DNA-binding transcriptional LysR family regulator